MSKRSAAVLLVVLLAVIAGGAIAMIALRSNAQPGASAVRTPDPSITTTPTSAPAAPHDHEAAARPKPAPTMPRLEIIGEVHRHIALAPPTGSTPGAVQVDADALARFCAAGPTHERMPGNLSTLIPAVDQPEDIAAIANVARDTKDDDTIRNEALNILRRSQVTGLADLCWALLKIETETERIRGFFAQHLSACDDSLAIPRLRILLADPHATVRREALAGLVRRDDRALDPHLADLMQRPDTADLAIEAAVQWNRRDLVAEVRRLAAHPEEPIRIAALLALGTWQDEASRGVIEAAASDPTARIQRAGVRAKTLLDRRQ
jgi:hypothetical protein